MFFSTYVSKPPVGAKYEVPVIYDMYMDVFSVNVSKPLVGAKYKVQLINVVYWYFFPQGSATVSDI